MTASSIEVPDPCLVLLVGPAGAGKSTFAARHFGTEEIVSSDDLRAAIAGDAADQSRNRAVFAALERAVARRLEVGRSAVVDATNVEAHARRSLLALAVDLSIPAIAIVLDLPLEAIHERNLARERVVDAAVVDRHHALLARLLARGTLQSEAFAAVHVLRGAAEVDAATVSRGRDGTLA